MFRKKKPSQILTDYIEGKGRGDELDDYVHSNLSAQEEIEVVEPLMEINRNYSNNKFFIGISNPDSFPEIAILAKKLKEIGL